MGRKTKLTEQLINKAERLIKAGNYNMVVCEYLNIHPSTWYKWMQEGEKAKSGRKKEFFDRVKKAEAEAEVRLITDLQKIASDNNSWQGIAWMLERKYPERWGKKDKVSADLNHSGQVTNKKEIEVDITKRIDQYEDIYSKVAQRENDVLKDE
ncbi:hypothetical protein [Halobacillus sp. H74]|uniref:hypothetical protein n=1 Tax=Halobacillus sp. H74 TaxID=3457436 RepID=UPI003FCD4D81